MKLTHIPNTVANPFSANAVGDHGWGAGRWWLVHTLPRCEKKIDLWFQHQKMKHYLPLQRSIRVYPGKKVVFYKPLFHGYAFGVFSPTERKKVLQSRLVARVIHIENQEEFHSQLENIRQAVESNVLLESSPYLKEGARVRITSGKLRGLEGFVLRLHGKTRLVLSVDIFHRSVSLEVDPLMVTAYT